MEAETGGGRPQLPIAGLLNPVIAVALGWWLLAEPVTGWTLGATALILAGVGGVLGSRPAAKRP